MFVSPVLLPCLNNILTTCTQDVFDPQKDNELLGIPSKYVNPKLVIRSNKFSVGLSEGGKNSYSLLCMYNPLNITLQTLTPLTWLLNNSVLFEQYRMYVSIMSRTPIIILYQGKRFMTNFYFLMKTVTFSDERFNSFFTKKKEIADGGKIAKKLFGYNTIFDTQDIEIDYASKNAQDYAVYNALYNEGAYTGIVSPQANNYVQILDPNETSAFSGQSFLKCLFQITMLGISFSNSIYYTLNNACVIINVKNDLSYKFTGKYWRKGTQANKISKTSEIFEKVLSRICDDQVENDKIEKEIGVKMTKYEESDKSLMCYSANENEQLIGNENDVNMTTYVYFAINLMKMTLGLEDEIKRWFALFLSGVLGQHWDSFLRFIPPRSKTMEIILNKIRKNYPDLPFLKHQGTPLADYIYAYKYNSESNILAGYNSQDFMSLLNVGIFSLRDKLKAETVYVPNDMDNAIFPIVFDNLILNISTDCYRSYRGLLDYMKTRKQRELLFENLTPYGKRVMTVLDPYGIFLFFQRDDRGLASTD